ncbi:MAG TPA: T9SS type A sorting domain-containing protein, partial [candidate division Zixibacteria bacterium]|nr:T9SS type A sorting domain-containing protein [candidate division Zixibacteria bacterium]
IKGDSVCLFLDTTGVYSATIYATNDCGVDTCLLVVEATRLTAPQVSCPGDTVLFSCAPDTVCLPFTFAPQSAFVSVNAPAYVNVETSEICIPITKDTTYTVTVSAQISCGVAQCSFTVTTDLNDKPQVTLPNDFAEFQCVFDSICIPVTIVDDELNVESITVNRGAYDPVRGVVCFLPPTIGNYAIIVSVTDACGAGDADTVNVNVKTGVAANIVCPQGVQSASLCAPGEVCLLVPVTAGVDSVITNIGSYNPVSKKLCFFADTSGLYEITIVAWAPCGVDTCEFVVDVEITPTPTLSCPGPIDTLLCVSQTDSLCVNIGMIAAGSTVQVKPVGAYADGYVCFPVDTPGVYTIDVLASTICGSDSCRLTVTVDDNNAPDLNVPTTLSIPRCPEDTDLVCISGIFANDAEGDNVTLTKICGPGQLNVTGGGTAELCFLPVAVDTTYEFCIQASDGCHTRTESFFVTVYPANDCGVCLTVSIDGPECTPVNREVSVFINVNAQDQIGGYDLLISYDPSALAFLTAGIGAAIADWEYFTYRQGPFGSCTGGGCPSGMLRLVAIADINDGANHPPSNALLPQGSLAEIRFRIVNNQNLGKIFVPVNFYWLDCGDNAFSDPTGQFLYVDQRIFNFEGGLVWDENDNSRYPESSRPFGLGAPDNCLIGDKYQPIRCVDFINGGVCIIDPEEIDARGDLNLNALAYEVADAVVYTNYFIVGLSAFIFSIDGQTAASDVNADGATLTVADLVYLVRVIIGDAAPIPKNIPGVAGANVQFQRDGDSFTITADADVALGAAHLVFEYDGVAPESITLGAGAAGMDLAYHIENGLIRALVYEDASHAQGRVIPAGISELIQVNMPRDGSGAVRLVQAELTDGMGWRVINANVITSTLPEKFELTQNYPNPFNPETIIEMALPTKSEWTLTIYNMLGQRVRRFDGLAEAGVVRIRWDGRDSDGSRVASGVYLYQAKAGSSVATKKMMLLK